jgi:hypothetical protein
MEALREQKRQGDEANRFHKEENARLSTAAQTVRNADVVLVMRRLTTRASTQSVAVVDFCWLD